jgi:hypothetical protein
MGVKARARACSRVLSLLFSETGGLFSLNKFTMRCVFRAQHKQSSAHRVSHVALNYAARRTKMKTELFFPAGEREREKLRAHGHRFSTSTPYWQWYYALEKSLKSRARTVVISILLTDNEWRHRMPALCARNKAKLDLKSGSILGLLYCWTNLKLLRFKILRRKYLRPWKCDRNYMLPQNTISAAKWRLIEYCTCALCNIIA